MVRERVFVHYDERIVVADMRRHVVDVGIESVGVESAALCANMMVEHKVGLDGTRRREVVVDAHVDVLGGGVSCEVDVRLLGATRWHQGWCVVQLFR